MAWVFSTNELLNGGNEFAFRFKEFLKANGCVILGSGDGNGGTYENTGGAGGTAGPYDIWATGTAGITSYTPGDAGNAGAWVRIQLPDGTRELLLQRYDQYSTGREDEWWIFYSPSAGFTGGTPSGNVRPTAMDEEYVVGSPSSSLPTSTFPNNGAICYAHFGIQDTAEGGVHPFYGAAFQQGTGVHTAMIFCESLNNAIPSDPDPCVWFGDTAATTSSLKSAAAQPTTADTVRGLTPGVGWETQEADGDRTLLQDNDGLRRAMAIRYGSVPSGGWKGTGRNFFWKASSALNYPDTANVMAADAKLHASDLLIPWETGVTPSV